MCMRVRARMHFPHTVDEGIDGEQGVLLDAALVGSVEHVQEDLHDLVGNLHNVRLVQLAQERLQSRAQQPKHLRDGVLLVLLHARTGRRVWWNRSVQCERYSESNVLSFRPTEVHLAEYVRAWSQRLNTCARRAKSHCNSSKCTT